MRALFSNVVCVAVVVVRMGVVGRSGCFESVAHKVAFHGVPFQAVLRRGEPRRVVREIVVVSMH